jgi:hypothetical protein
MNILKQPLQRVLAAGVALASLALPAASPAAQITFEMRAVEQGVLLGDTTSAGVTINNPHSVIATGANQVIVLQLYAIIQNLDGNHANDGFQQVYGSFLSSSSGLSGNLRGDTNFVVGGQTQINNVPGANAGVAQAGFQFDLNGGGGLDVGSNATDVPGVPLPWFLAVGGSGIGGTTFGVGAGAGGTEILIAETTFTLGPESVGSTSINFAPRQWLTGGTLSTRKHIVFRTDSTTVITSLAYGDPNYDVGSAVNILIPEPSAIGMLMLGTLGLVGFRRSAFRRLSA